MRSAAAARMYASEIQLSVTAETSHSCSMRGRAMLTAEAMKVLRKPAVVATRSTILCFDRSMALQRILNRCQATNAKTTPTSYLSLYATTFMVGRGHDHVGAASRPHDQGAEHPPRPGRPDIGGVRRRHAGRGPGAELPLRPGAGQVGPHRGRLAADRGPGGLRQRSRKVCGRSLPPISSWASVASSSTACPGCG